jgi:hypothetical protein
MKVVGLVDKAGVFGDWLDTLERRKNRIWIKVKKSWLRTG